MVGAGKEALKRIKALLNQNCEITVISDEVNKSIESLANRKVIYLKKQKLENANFLSSDKPHMVITTTNNRKLNQKIINKAKKSKIIAYSSDNPESSDFSNPAIIDFENIVQVAVFTGGKSPIMSKKIKENVENAVKKIITKEDLTQIKIQQIARDLAKGKITSQSQRKSFLKTIINDKRIKQLIKDGQTKKIENRILTIMRDWE